MTDPREAVKATSLDLWVCHHFKVLPTDDRFKRLTPRQKDFLYLGWLELPTSDQIKEWYTAKKGDPVVSTEDSKNFQKLGYTSEQIKHMKDQLKKAGFRQE